MTKKIIVLLLLLICITRLFAQRERLDSITDSISDEGKALYHSEWASWYGTDIFEEKCKSQRSLSGGYISYETNENFINVFYSKGDDPTIISTIIFGKDFDAHNYKLDTTVRKLNKTENELYAIRKAALKRINADTTFKRFKNTNLNPVPIIRNGTKRVYVLTGPEVNGVVVFGNDYLINFDSDDEITSVKKLHKNIIVANYKGPQADSGKTEVAAMHSHLPESGDFITATDICTLLLYEKFTTWNTYYVISKNYVSIWDCKKDRLIIMTMEAWKKIGIRSAIESQKQ